MINLFNEANLRYSCTGFYFSMRPFIKRLHLICKYRLKKLLKGPRPGRQPVDKELQKEQICMKRQLVQQIPKEAYIMN